MKSGPMISSQSEFRRMFVPLSAIASFTTSQTLILPL